MTWNGTVVNGVIVLDGPPPPDGTRVRFWLADEEDDTAAAPHVRHATPDEPEA